MKKEDQKVQKQRKKRKEPAARDTREASEEDERRGNAPRLIILLVAIFRTRDIREPISDRATWTRESTNREDHRRIPRSGFRAGDFRAAIAAKRQADRSRRDRPTVLSDLIAKCASADTLTLLIFLLFLSLPFLLSLSLSLSLSPFFFLFLLSSRFPAADRARSRCCSKRSPRSDNFNLFRRICG